MALLGPYFTVSHLAAITVFVRDLQACLKRRSSCGCLQHSVGPRVLVTLWWWPEIALSSLATWTSPSGSLLPHGVGSREAIERVYTAKQKLQSFVTESWTLPQLIYTIVRSKLLRERGHKVGSTRWWGPSSRTLTTSSLSDANTSILLFFWLICI